MQTSETEKFNKCFSALGHSDNRAYHILVGEITRLGADERILDRKKVTIKVLNESQKIIADTILLLIKSKMQENKDFSLDPREMEIKIVGEFDESDEDRVIDLGNFDYDTEKAKFIRRCNSTIIANSDIRDAIVREINGDNTYTQEIRDAQELETLRRKYNSVKAWLNKNGKGVFAFFRKKEIGRSHAAEEELSKDIKRVEEKIAYRNYSRKKANERIKMIKQKEDTLEGIKYMFTGRREALVSRRDKDGKMIKTFQAAGITLREERYASKKQKQDQKEKIE